MIERFGYPGILSAPKALLEAQQIEWMARKQAEYDNARDEAST